MVEFSYFYVKCCGYYLSKYIFRPLLDFYLYLIGLQ